MSKLRIIFLVLTFHWIGSSFLFAEEPVSIQKYSFYYTNIIQLKENVLYTLEKLTKGTAQEVFTIYTYDNTNSGTLSNQTSCTTNLQRTFEVSDNFTINDLDVGVNMEHTWRGDVQITLTSPSNTSVVIVAFSSDNYDGYDILLNDESGNALNDNNNDNNGAPNYGADRSAAPSNPLSAFDGELATGTWTLTFCNDDQGAGSNGRILTFNNAQLAFDGIAASGTNHKFLTILKKITFFDRKIKWPLQEDKLQHHRYQ